MSTTFEAPPLAGRGLKGLFSRTRLSTPDPNAERTVKSRLRSFINEPHIRPASRRSSKADPQPLPSYHPPVPSKSQVTGRQSPGRRRPEKVAVSALPIIQRGEDGKWQPPSLSQGSMSTSALAIYADEQPKAEAGPSNRKARVALSAYFDQGHSDGIPTQSTSIAGSSRRPLQANPVALEALEERGEKTGLRASSTEATISSRQRSLPASTSASSTIDPILSYEHYILRLAVSFLIRSLPPILRSSAFIKTAKTAEMKIAAEQKLAMLHRMEKTWGTDWSQAAKLVQNSRDEPWTLSGGGPLSSLEDKVRRVSVGKRTKEREGRHFAEALADGILLCLLLNHLFPSQPPHITRVNMSEDALVRATNLTCFTLACHAVGLPSGEVFGISDLQEGSEISLGKVAKTIIALARLAGKSNAGVGRPRSAPMPSPIMSSQPRSHMEAAPIPQSPPASMAKPRRAGDAGRRLPSDARRPVSGPPGLTNGANDLQSRLQTMSSVQSAETEMEDSPKTPVAPVFTAPDIAKAEESPPGVHRPQVPRSQTQPIQSSMRPKSPISETSSRCATPTGRLTPTAGRPILRPRYSSGSRPQVTAVNGLPTLTSCQARDGVASTGASRVGLHVQERTPSLISSRSRVTSGYSRSSGVQSVVSFPSGDYSQAAPWSPDENGLARTNSTDYFDLSQGSVWQAAMNGQAFVDSKGVPRDARGFALSQSLAALEGQATRSVDLPSTPTGRVRPSSRLSRVDVSRVIEEDELAISPVSPTPRPPIRRISTNGKTYVPKRSLSPRPIDVPLTSSIQDDRTRMPPPPLPAHDLEQRPPTLMARRQSETAAVNQARAGSESRSDSPMNMRTSSMVNLSGVPSSFERSNSSFSTKRSSQVLELSLQGRPPIKYQLGNCIGRGQFGSVFRSLNTTTGQMVAVKRINLSGLQESEINGVMHEVELLKSLDHPSIVKYEGMIKDDEYLNIILEYVENGSLGQTLKAFGNFNENLVSTYVTKILEGLTYLHSQGVVHCDLKAANILSTKNGNIKLSDFGVSLVTRAVVNIKRDSIAARAKGKSSSRPGTDIAGTPNWMAPEVISLNGASPPSDIWSLGCTIIEMLTGRPPYADITNSMTVLFRIVEDEMPPIPDNISDDLRDFFHLCFIKDPSARPSATTLSLHPWVCKDDVKMERQMDSVPFLRRVSMTTQRPSSSVFPVFEENLTRPPSMALTVSRPTSVAITDSSVDELAGHDYQKTHLAETPTRAEHGPISMPPTPKKAHKLVKTSFSKAILCRVCHSHVKKSGVLCQSCGMICHTACANSAVANCDITQQLSLLARQEELLQIATMSSTHSFHTAHSTAGPQRSISSRRPSGIEDDAMEGGENAPLRDRLLSGLGGLRLRKESFNGPSRTRLSSRRSSKALPLVPATENEALSVSPDDTRRHSAIRFELDDASAASKVKTLKKVPARGVDVEIHTARGPATEDKSDCVVM